jgi:hypothetical protein
MSRTFHNLSAGSTTIMPSGKVIRFGGKVQQVEGGTKVGVGTITTDNAEEIEWLDHLCKLPTPQVWEEKVEADLNAPAKVVSGVVADVKKAAADNEENAARSTNPAVVKLQENLGKVIADASTKK